AELLIEWQVNGAKSTVESAKTTLTSIFSGKTAFVQKWLDAKNNKLMSPNRQTDEFGVDFLVTTCIPNAICDYQSPIWKKVTISKQEIASLVQTFTSEVPASVVAEFGNVEPELDSISFEYCILDIQRSWFDESVVNSKYWKYADSSAMISSGDESMTGQIPAYPAKLVLSKNIELAFTPNAAVNEDIKNKLKAGTRLFFGSLMLKTIPVNLANNSINTFKIQQVTSNELNVMTNVAAQNLGTTNKINTGNRFMNFGYIKQPLAFRNTVEVKSIRPTTLVASTKIAAVTPPQKTGPTVATRPMVVTGVTGFQRPPIIIARPIGTTVGTTVKTTGTTIGTTTGTTGTTQPVSTTSDISGKVFDANNQ
ncbi:MAG TPA: hypothetical protein VKH37_02920, partial [Ferruginibacter sp.]|nr:hypothetical protein [Ferruginibacter sp.]